MPNKQLWVGFLLVIFCCSISSACKPTCPEQSGEQEDLRPFFAKCLRNKLGAVRKWKLLVNYVVWNDIWYEAVKVFYCKNKGVSCWTDRVNNFLKVNSGLRTPIKQCISEYAGTNTTRNSTTCEDPVYKPRIVKQFVTMKGCPLSPREYINCLGSTLDSITKTMSVKPGQNVLRPKYDFLELSDFMTKHRSDCRITRYSRSSYVTSCAAFTKPATSNAKPATISRSKRALSLKDILERMKGGKLNIRVSSSGTAKILPSGPLVPKITNTPKCFAGKLQMVIVPRTALSSAASRCNTAATKKVTKRVSTAFRVAYVPKKEPGQKGVCKPTDEWTPWYSRDKPDHGTGDLESFSSIRINNMKDVCYNPTAIQALLVKNNQSYTSAGQNVKIQPRFGLSCYNYKQKNKKCEDYKVRFCCPKL